MDVCRSLIRNNRACFALLLAAALLLKMLVPAGYMVSGQNMVLTVSVCTDSTSGHIARQISIPTRNSAGQEHGPKRGGANSECPFTALTMSGLGGVDAALLAAPVAFALALGFAPQTVRPLRGSTRLRPPLRGPPLAG